MRREKELLAVTLKELENVGITPTVEHKTHIKVRWQGTHGQRLVIISQSCSGIKAMKNTRSLVRRILREDGLLTA